MLRTSSGWYSVLKLPLAGAAQAPLSVLRPSAFHRTRPPEILIDGEMSGHTIEDVDLDVGVEDTEHPEGTSSGEQAVGIVAIGKSQAQANRTYTTISSLVLMPSFSTHCLKYSGVESMWGRGTEVSAILSMLKNWAVGIRFCRKRLGSACPWSGTRETYLDKLLLSISAGIQVQSSI